MLTIDREVETELETKRDREKDRDSEFRSCVKVEVAVLGFPS